MAWVRLDDAFYDHRKFGKAGPLGMAMWVSAVAWSNRNLTDGKFPRSTAKRILDFEGIAWGMWSNGMFGGGEDAEGIAVAEHLVECGLFDRDGDDYLIHDYLDYQRSAAEIKDLSEKRSESGKRGVAVREANRQATANQLAKQTHEQTPSKPEAEPQPQPQPPPSVRAQNTPASASLDAEFEKFWKTYPRRVGKQAARKVWDKARKTTSTDVILAAAERYRDDPNRSPQFTAHPTTWLNQGRWDDEPLPDREPVLSITKVDPYERPRLPDYVPAEVPDATPSVPEWFKRRAQ